MGGTGSQNLHHNNGAPSELYKEEQRSGTQEPKHSEKSVTTRGQPNYAFQNWPSFGKNTCIDYFSCMMSKVLKVLCMKCNRNNCMHAGGVERNTCIIHCIIILGSLRKSR